MGGNKTSGVASPEELSRSTSHTGGRSPITVAVWLVICVLAGANAIRSTLQVRRVRSTYFMVWGFVAGVLITLQWMAVWANLDRAES